MQKTFSLFLLLTAVTTGIAQTGRVGIGTTAPAIPFDVVGDTIGIRNSVSQWDNLWFHISGSTANITASGADSGLRFRVGRNVLGNYGSSNQSFNTVMSLLPSGSIGIGTNTPTVFSQFSNTSKNTIGSDNNGGNPGSFSWAASQGGYAAQIYNGSTTGFPGGLAVKVLNTNANALDVSSGAQDSTGNPLFVVKASGNIGIGITSPHAPLHFANTVVSRKIVLFEAANNDHQFYGFGVTPEAVRYQIGDPATSHVFYSGTSSSTSAELLRITGTGRVGVGVSNPYSQLSNTSRNTLGADGNGGNPGSLSWVANQNGYVAQIFNGSTTDRANGLAVKVRGTSSVAFDVSSGPQDTVGTSLFVVKATGNVGIGIGNPLTKLDVIAGASSAAFRVAGGSGQTRSAGLLVIQDSSNNTSTTLPNILLACINADYEVIGGISRYPNSNSIGFATSSDIRMKTNIRPTHYGLNDLMAIEVADYKYKSVVDAAPQTGFLAQQLYTVYPEAVIKGNDTDVKQPYMVDYSRLTPLLVKAVQELKAQVDALQNENKALKASTNTELEARLKRLEARMAANPETTTARP